MSEEILSVAREEGVLTVTLNRPKARNALNQALIAALAVALEDGGKDAEVRAIVLTGSGGSFCSGADLKAAMTEGGLDRLDERVDSFHRVIRAIIDAPKPVVAKVSGAAVGFGCDLALACDLRICATDAYFQEKFVKIGLMPDGGGTFWLPRLVGLARAMEIMLLGEPVKADRALAIGLVNQVVAVDALDAVTTEIARALAKGPPLAFAQMKRAVRLAQGGSIDAALTEERAGQLRCLQSGDAMEGIMAWMEKREPAFRGQ